MKICSSSFKVLLCFVVTMFSVSVFAGPKAKVLEYGYYEFTKGSERMANELSTSGYVTRGAAKLVKKTEKIPLKRGRLFGFRFKISGMEQNVGVIPLELVVTHPEMKKPDGSLSTGYRYKMDLSLSNGVVEDKTGYRVNEALLMVEGDNLRYFGAGLAQFIYQTLLYVTYNSDIKPFPFSSWPESEIAEPVAEQDDAEDDLGFEGKVLSEKKDSE